MPQCCVAGCRQQGVKGVPSYGFPKKEDKRFKLWLSAARIQIHKGTALKYLRVCIKHFAESAFEPSSLLKRALMPGRYICGPTLKPTAVPTLCLPPKCSTPRPGTYPCCGETRGDSQHQCGKNQPQQRRGGVRTTPRVSGRKPRAVQQQVVSPQEGHTQQSSETHSGESVQSDSTLVAELSPASSNPSVPTESSPLPTGNPTAPGSALGTGSTRQQLVQQVSPHPTSPQHTRTVPPSKPTRPGNTPTPPEPPCRFECAECLARYRSKPSLRAHLVRTHLSAPPGTPLCCEMCPQRFSSAAELSGHMVSRHIPLLMCPTCGALSPSLDQLRAHHSEHHGQGAWLEQYKLDKQNQQKATRQKKKSRPKVTGSSEKASRKAAENVVTGEVTSDLATLPATGSEFVSCDVVEDLDPVVPSEPDSTVLEYSYQSSMEVDPFGGTEVEPSLAQAEKEQGLEICEIPDDYFSESEEKDDQVDLEEYFEGNDDRGEGTTDLVGSIITEEVDLVKEKEIDKDVIVQDQTEPQNEQSVDSEDECMIVEKSVDCPQEKVDLGVKDEGDLEEIEIKDEQPREDSTCEILPGSGTVECETLVVPNSAVQLSYLTLNSSPLSSCVVTSNLPPKPTTKTGVAREQLPPLNPLVTAGKPVKTYSRIQQKSMSHAVATAIKKTVAAQSNSSQSESSSRYVVLLLPKSNASQQSTESAPSTIQKTIPPLVFREQISTSHPVEVHSTSENTSQSVSEPLGSAAIVRYVPPGSVLPTFTCTSCSLSFNHLYDFVSHTSSRHSLTVQCFCGERFSSLFPFQAHLIQGHGIDNALQLIGRALTRASYVRVGHISPFTCLICGILFHSNPLLYEHVDTCHKNFCFKCGMVYNSSKTVPEDHYTQNPACKELDRRSSLPGVRCALCKHSGTRESIIEHVRTHVLVDCKSCTDSLIASTTDSPEQCVDCVREGRLLGQHDSLTDIKIRMQLEKNKTAANQKKTPKKKIQKESVGIGTSKQRPTGTSQITKSRVPPSSKPLSSKNLRSNTQTSEPLSASSSVTESGTAYVEIFVSEATPSTEKNLTPDPQNVDGPIREEHNNTGDNPNLQILNIVYSPEPATKRGRVSRDTSCNSFLLALHLTGSGYPCLYCDARFPNELHISSHLHSAHLMCKFCMFRFSDPAKKRAHETMHQDTPNLAMFSCSVCQTRFRSMDLFERHKVFHRGVVAGCAVVHTLPVLHFKEVKQHAQCVYCHATGIRDLEMHCKFAHGITLCPVGKCDQLSVATYRSCGCK